MASMNQGRPRGSRCTHPVARWTVRSEYSSSPKTYFQRFGGAVPAGGSQLRSVALVSYSMEQWSSPTKEVVFDSFAGVVKAFGSGRRLELLELLAQGEHSVESLARMTGAGLTAVSANLQTLKKANLVRTRREGTTIYYRLAGDDVAELYVVAKRVAMRRSPDLREVVLAYMDQVSPGIETPTIDPAAVTSDMTVVDVRPGSEFDAGHFPGAVSIPLVELDDRAGELPMGHLIVVYCRGEFCRMAREAAHRLRERGLDACAMDEGVVEWRVSKGVNLDGVA